MTKTNQLQKIVAEMANESGRDITGDNYLSQLGFNRGKRVYDQGLFTGCKN